MATPQRRSSRLRSATPQNRDSVTHPISQLSSLLERDETPNKGIQSNLDSIASSPAHGFQKVQKTNSHASLIPSPLKTPLSAVRPRPGPEEMHPSHFHGTAKKAGASGEDVDNDHHESNQDTPTKLAAAICDTPSKTQKSQKTARMAFSSPTFEFKMTRPSTELSTEAQKMMDEVREQAARIKEELLSQREEQVRKDSETDKLFGYEGRRIAKPKGKVGRFSDVHMEQFKKMDSIVNHPSSFRSDVTRAVPTKSLKRSNSHAELDNIEPGVKRSSSQKSPRDDNFGSPQSPSKRLKQQHVFKSKPKNSPFDSSPAAAGASQIFSPTSKLQSPSTITTPTKAPLARSSSVKSLGKTKSKIPSFGRSPSLQVLSTPITISSLSIQTEGNNKYRNALANKLTSVRSILKRPQLRFSDDPLKLAAGTHVTTPRNLSALKYPVNFEKQLPAVPEDSPTLRTGKRVNFTASTNDNTLEDGETAPSSTPTKQTTPSPLKISYPVLPGTGSPVRGNANQTMVPISSGVPSSPRRPGDFTFRADQTIVFNTATPQARTPGTATPTIRKVRPSVPAAIESHAPTAPAVLGPLLPSIPHGLTNRKRKHDDVADEAPNPIDAQSLNAGADGDKENRCGSEEAEAAEGSPAKKARLMPVSAARPKPTPLTPKSPAAVKARAKIRANAAAAAAASSSSAAAAAAAGKPKATGEQRRGKGFLSLSRLNALAMPKARK